MSGRRWHWRRLCCGAALVLSCALATTARGQDWEPSAAAPGSPGEREEGAAAWFSLDQPLHLAAQAPRAATTDRRFLMQGLDAIGAARVLDDWKVDVRGYLEFGWAHSTAPVEFDGRKRIRTQSFNFEHDDPTLNQLALIFERPVDARKKQWDVGFNVHWIWGGDARFVHAFGLFDHYGRWDAGNIEGGPDEQFDLFQVYVDVAVPVGNGLRLRLGKFASPIGGAAVDPNLSPFYTRTLIFQGLPLTFTGVMGTYYIDDHWSVDAAITRGWDQALEDENAVLSYVARVTYTADRWTASAGTVFGPESAVNNSAYWLLVDAGLSYRLTDEWTILANAHFIRGRGEDSVPGENFEVYGLTGQVIYTPWKWVDFKGRLEWFYDADGRQYGFEAHYYSATLGLTIRPLAGQGPVMAEAFKIRPEVRFMYATEPVFDNNDQQNQVVFAIDAIINF